MVRAGGPGGRSSSLRSARTPSSTPGAAGTLAPSPSPRPGAPGSGAPGRAELLPTLPGAPGPGGGVARREENGVGCSYLSEFSAHQDEEEEAEELPGRWHVSRPPPTSWRAGGPGCSAAGGCVDADALPALLCWLRGGARPCPCAFSTGSRWRAGSAARSLRSASRARRAAPRSAGLGGGRGGPPLGPSSAPPPNGPAPAQLGRAAAPPGCQKFAGKGRGRGGAEGPARHARAREQGGWRRRRGSRLGQDVTSKRRGKFNWGENFTLAGGSRCRAPGPWRLEWGPPGPGPWGAGIQALLDSTGGRRAPGMRAQDGKAFGGPLSMR